MYSSNDFKFRAIRLVMLVLNFSEIWRVESESRFQALCAKYVFWRFSYGFTITVYQHWQPKICDQFVKTFQ
jgi:hypothetical protein